MASIFDACYNGQLDALKELIKIGVKTNTKDNIHERTPLQWAMVGKHAPIVQYLLDLNIASNAELLIGHRDRYKKTVKDYAIQYKRYGENRLLAILDAWKQKKFCPVLVPHEAPSAPCSWRFMRTKMMQVDTSVVYYNGALSDRYPICSETLHGQLTHYSQKTGTRKWSLSLDAIHHQLRSDLMKMANRDGNIIAVNITFEFKIDNTLHYQSHSFPLKIAGCDVFTISDAHDYVQTANHNCNAYSVLKPLYEQGKAIINADHGHQPQYESNNPSHEQFKNHSEQALAAYLSTPAAAQQLVERFINSLHAKNLAAHSTIKIYLVALHIHSNKTPCGACEQVLLGTQNNVTRNRQLRGRYFGFIEQLETALLKKNDMCNFRIPTRVSTTKKGGIRCYVTYSADTTDVTHRTAYAVHRASSNEATNIDTSHLTAAKNLHVARFQPSNVAPFKTGRQETYVGDRTFFSSASRNNKKTPEKEAQYKHLCADKELDFSDYFARLGMP